MKKGQGIGKMMTPESVYLYAKEGLKPEDIGKLYGLTRQRISQVIRDDEQLQASWDRGHADLLRGLMPHVWKRFYENDIVMIFILKSVFGFCEEQYKIGKVTDAENIPKIQIFLPDNQRDESAPFL